MSSTELPESDRDGGDGEAVTTPERLTGICAALGGLLTLAVALLATVSVLLRWLISSPIDGDFEYVKMATAVAVFCISLTPRRAAVTSWWTPSLCGYRSVR